MNYAGFWKRYFARLVDSLLVVPLFIINSYFFAAKNENLYSLFITIINILVILYMTLSVFFTGKTIGKKAMGLKVQKTNGDKVTLINSFLRESFTVINVLFFILKCFIPGVKSYHMFLTIFLSLEPLAYFFTIKRKALHDFIGDTVVVYDKV